VHTESPDLDCAALVAVLRGWELQVTSLRYLPVGAGSHHYLATDTEGRRWFVTVDELLVKLFGMMGPTFVPWLEVDLDAGYEVLDRAFQTVAALRAAGLEFVHAPITRPDGAVLTRLGDFAVSVFPYIDDISDEPMPDRRHRLLSALGELHAATGVVPQGLPQRDTLTVPLRPRFLAALDDLRRPWDTGPYGEPARLLLESRADAIRDLFRRCDEVGDAVRAADRPWVVTHGQVHELNVVRTHDGRLLLVDWDCVAVAPRERDLGTWENELDPRTEDDWAAYTAAGEPRDIDRTAAELYALVGLLWTICADTELFRSPHVDSGDTRHEWRNLEHALAQVPG
jgi:spectinomycin phosphotransferase